MKLYKKLAFINAGLGIFIATIILFSYSSLNNIIGIPILNVFFSSFILHIVITIIVNIMSIIIIIYIKNLKIVGASLMICGMLILSSLFYFGIPSFILFIISGILALKDK
ncbi:MAG: hypothetical protein ACPKPY_08005 [Nitrososphaeraceae archaeon]